MTSISKAAPQTSHQTGAASSTDSGRSYWAVPPLPTRCVTSPSTSLGPSLILSAPHNSTPIHAPMHARAARAALPSAFAAPRPRCDRPAATRRSDGGRARSHSGSRQNRAEEEAAKEGVSKLNALFTGEQPDILALIMEHLHELERNKSHLVLASSVLTCQPLASRAWREPAQQYFQSVRRITTPCVWPPLLSIPTGFSRSTLEYKKTVTRLLSRENVHALWIGAEMAAGPWDGRLTVWLPSMQAMHTAIGAVKAHFADVELRTEPPDHTFTMYSPQDCQRLRNIRAAVSSNQQNRHWSKQLVTRMDDKYSPQPPIRNALLMKIDDR